MYKRHESRSVWLSLWLSLSPLLLITTVCFFLTVILWLFLLLPLNNNWWCSSYLFPLCGCGSRLGIVSDTSPRCRLKRSQELVFNGDALGFQETIQGHIHVIFWYFLVLICLIWSVYDLQVSSVWVSDSIIPFRLWKFESLYQPAFPCWQEGDKQTYPKPGDSLLSLAFEEESPWFLPSKISI